MSMSTHITGLRSPDSAKHRAMVDAAMALERAGIEALPREMAEYFGSHVSASDVRRDQTLGCAVDIKNITETGSGDGCTWWRVDVRALPKGTTHVLFENCW